MSNPTVANTGGKIMIGVPRTKETKTKIPEATDADPTAVVDYGA